MDDRASPEGVSAIDRETVARAMLRANSQCQIGGDGDWPRWETLTPPQQEKFLHIADAAIAAMAPQAPPAAVPEGYALVPYQDEAVALRAEVEQLKESPDAAYLYGFAAGKDAAMAKGAKP